MWIIIIIIIVIIIDAWRSVSTISDPIESQYLFLRLCCL